MVAQKHGIAEDLDEIIGRYLAAIKKKSREAMTPTR